MQHGGVLPRDALGTRVTKTVWALVALLVALIIVLIWLASQHVS